MRPIGEPRLTLSFMLFFTIAPPCVRYCVRFDLPFPPNCFNMLPTLSNGKGKHHGRTTEKEA